jgi:hypothetical protein
VRTSSAYYAQSNGRAEAGVKSLKRLMKGNTGRKGSLHIDDLAQALLQYRNTPLRDVNNSPAQLALGRVLRDTLPLPTKRYRINPHWAQFLTNRERSMAQKNEMVKAEYDQHSKLLTELCKGDAVLCQNAKTKKWDRSGVIVEVGKYRQYSVKMDGSGRLSLRNRRHLQKIKINIPDVPHIVTTTPTAPTHVEDSGPSDYEDVDNNYQARHNEETVPAYPPWERVLPRRSDRVSTKPQRYGIEDNGR